MLRKTKDGGYERQDAEGKWVPVPAEEALAASSGVSVAPEPEVDQADVSQMIDSLVDELNGSSTVAEPEEPLRDYAKIEDQERAEIRAADEAAPPPAIDTESAPGDFDLEVPGLVSTDSSRGSRGFQTVKERLKANARKRREPRKVEVGAAAARVSGPAKGEGTERRQQLRTRERAEAGKKVSEEIAARQRYVNRPAPALFEGRPRWVQDLFEAHFRSEHTLQMRRAHNRMKISRQDYAIGWLTAFDKFREESSLLRLKEKDAS